MLRSMYSAVGALNAHQTYLNVIANNLANVNTTGYKASRVSFNALISQLLQAGSAPTTVLGGRNPMQVGMGVNVGAISPIFTQGTLVTTNRLSDLAIQGDGFFIYNGPNGALYSRDGALDLDSQGYLVNGANGLRVQGWLADATGAVDSTQPIGDIQVPSGAAQAQATANAILAGNLNASAIAGDTATTTVVAYDSLGVAHDLTFTFTRTANPNEWSWTAAGDPADTAVGAIAVTGGTITFDADGQYATPAVTSISIALANGSTTPQAVTLDMTGLAFLGQPSSVNLASQDGLAAGTLTGFSVVSNTGELIGLYSNGKTQALGQVALATFTNPTGLLSVGQNLYQAWINSGEPQVGTPASGARGTITPGYLEGSNVDLAQEFTNMIVAQRGFQANSRVITTSDEVLQDLINMKR